MNTPNALTMLRIVAVPVIVVALLDQTQDGDVIAIDVPAHRLDLEVDAAEVTRRLAALPEFEPRAKTGYLRRYARYVTSASTGAVLSEG